MKQICLAELTMTETGRSRLLLTDVPCATILRFFVNRIQFFDDFVLFVNWQEL